VRRPSRRGVLRGLGVALAGALVRTPTMAARGTVWQPEFVHTREAWAAAPAGARMRPHQVERVTLHHTGPPAWEGMPSAAVYLRGIQAFHMGPERRWPDIAYHLLIDLDGVVWEGRSLAFAGDTATAYDPSGHALVAVLGDYDRQRPTVAQVDAIVQTVRRLLEAYGLDAAVVGGHRDYAATACPGGNLYGLLPEIRATL